MPCSRPGLARGAWLPCPNNSFLTRLGVFPVRHMAGSGPCRSDPKSASAACCSASAAQSVQLQACIRLVSGERGAQMVDEQRLWMSST